MPWRPVYTPLYFDISHTVFVCFMLSLICADAATDFFTMHMIIPFPILMFHIYFQFLIIIFVTFDMNSHQWGWYNCTKVYHAKLLQWGKRLNQDCPLVWKQLVIFIPIVLVRNFMRDWHQCVWSSSLDLKYVNNSFTIVLSCLHLLCFRLHLHMFGFVSNTFFHPLN